MAMGPGAPQECAARGWGVPRGGNLIWTLSHLFASCQLSGDFVSASWKNRIEKVFYPQGRLREVTKPWSAGHVVTGR